MSILLLGAEGQVGHALQTALLGIAPVMAATRSGQLAGGLPCLRVDLSNFESITAIIQRERPQWIINAAAYTAVDRAESESDIAQRINAEAVGVIGEHAAKIDARVVHFSTDYVFAGHGDQPWREADPIAPLNVYGRSKADGEQALRASGASHLILRTAWVYGARGQNFLRTMLRAGTSHDALRVVSDQFGTPTTATLIAQITARLVSILMTADARDTRFGTYHLTADGHTSWHGFAEAIFAQAQQAGLITRAPSVQAIGSADYPTAAQRPNWSVMNTQKLRDTFSLHLPHWQSGLCSTISQIADERTRWPSST